MKILLLGPQGSGKSTQAKLLADKFNLAFISIGDLVREKAKENSEEGKRIKAIMERGDLVDDATVASLFKEKMKDSGGLVTDSYPRRISQVETFDPGMEYVFYLTIPEEEVVGRMAGRGRVDDTKEAIEKRLRIYKEETQPLLDYYKKLGKLIEVSAAGSIEEVNARILEHLDG